jgi:hypothetical protein
VRCNVCTFCTVVEVGKIRIGYRRREEEKRKTNIFMRGKITIEKIKFLARFGLWRSFAKNLNL